MAVACGVAELEASHYTMFMFLTMNICRSLQSSLSDSEHVDSCLLVLHAMASNLKPLSILCDCGSQFDCYPPLVTYDISVVIISVYQYMQFGKGCDS